MEKILASADKALSDIGRFVLLWPRLSGISLLLIIILTLLSNGIFKFLPRSHQGLMGSSLLFPIPHNQFALNSEVVSPDSSPLLAHSPNNISDWKTIKINPGDTLFQLFKAQKISVKDVLAISTLPGSNTLRHLKVGQEMRLRVSEGHLQQLVYAVNDKSTLTINLIQSKFNLALKSGSLDANLPPLFIASNSKNLTTSPVAPSPVSNEVVFLPGGAVNQPILKKSNSAQLMYASGEIHHSLYSDARKVGLTSRQANQLVQIFGQKNVTQNLHVGDRFYVLYDTNNKKKGAGSILIARLMHSGKDYQWIRFTDPKGHTDYYTPQGQSAKEGISRQPLHYTHIASRFSKSRFHPLLHFMRPHLGVDYAAPLGTPIKAAGDGFIAEAGYKGGYGRAVLLKHDSKYATLYGHLSRFASNMHVGSFVRQGQVIGYVGQSGLASGPHLHYEIHVNNVPHDPLSVALPGASVAKVYRSQFLAQARFLLAQLNMHKQIRLANQSDPPKRS